MARTREKACSFYRRKGTETQREKVIPMSGVVLEWKTLLSIDNRYSLSKAKLKPECPSRGSTIRAHAAILYTYTYIQRQRKFYLFSEQHTEYLWIVHARYLFSLLYVYYYSSSFSSSPSFSSSSSHFTSSPVSVETWRAAF